MFELYLNWTVSLRTFVLEELVSGPSMCFRYQSRSWWAAASCYSCRLNSSYSHSLLNRKLFRSSRWMPCPTVWRGALGPQMLVIPSTCPGLLQLQPLLLWDSSVWTTTPLNSRWKAFVLLWIPWVSDPDPSWIRVYSDPWIRNQEGRNDNQKQKIDKKVQYFWRARYPELEGLERSERKQNRVAFFILRNIWIFFSAENFSIFLLKESHFSDHTL